MKIYYLGSNSNTHSEIIAYYHLQKKTGNFLIEKTKRAKKVFLLEKTGDYLSTTLTTTDVEYKNKTDEVIAYVNRTVALKHIYNKLYGKPGGGPVLARAAGPVSTKEKLTYEIDGTIVVGDFDEILAICKKYGKALELKNLRGIDKSKYYLSESKDQLLLISDMNTTHVMRALTKKIRDYYDNLKFPNDISISNFFDKLEKWITDSEVQNLVVELEKRNTK